MMRKFLAVFVMVLMLGGVSWAFINPSGMGSSLVFPYFNARGNNLTFIRFVNTSPTDTLVVKVRVREGKQSKELRDFIVCLSPRDQFSFWIGSGQLFGANVENAVLVKGEKVGVYGDSDTATIPEWQVYRLGTLDDPEESYEGYVEVLSLARVQNFDITRYATTQGLPKLRVCAEIAGTIDSFITNAQQNVVFSGSNAALRLGYYVVQGQNVPQYGGSNILPAGGLNLLKGEAYVFNLSSPYRSYAYRAVAISTVGRVSNVIWWCELASVSARKGFPTLTQVCADSLVQIQNTNNWYTEAFRLNAPNAPNTPWLNVQFAGAYVTDLFSFYNLSNFYQSATALLVDFPLKREYINWVNGLVARQAVNNPNTDLDRIKANLKRTYFDPVFTGTKCTVDDAVADNTNCCVSFDAWVYDDKEHLFLTFSPTSGSLCYEVNYMPIVFDDDPDYRILDTELVSENGKLLLDKALLTGDFKMGWFRLSFVDRLGNRISFLNVPPALNGVPVFAYEIQEFLGKQFSHVISLGQW